jgi:hypothetical protein
LTSALGASSETKHLFRFQKLKKRPITNDVNLPI